MEDFVCEALSSDDSPPRQTTKQNNAVSTQKKLRRTQDLFQLLNKSGDDRKGEVVKAVRNTRPRQNLFLPKIEDAQSVTCQTPSTRKQNRESVNKKRVALKVIQRRIEQRVLNSKKTISIRVHIEPILESPENLLKQKPATVVSNSKKEKVVEFYKELYIPLVPLEKTELLKKHNIELFKRNTSTGSVLDLLPNINCISAVQDFLRPCSVKLKRLPLDVVNQYLNICKEASLNNNVEQKNLDTFIPVVTSSPLISSTQLNSSNHAEQMILSTSISHQLLQTTECVVNSSDSHTSTSKEGDGTYTVINPNETNITFRRNRAPLSSRMPIKIANDSNSTVIVTSQEESGLYILGPDYNAATNNFFTPLKAQRYSPNDSDVTPISALKSNKSSRKNKANRVTFSNTSVMIIYDSDVNSSDTYRESYRSPIPIASQNLDTSKSKKILAAGRTPFYPKKALSDIFNSPSVGRLISSTPKISLHKHSNSSKPPSKVAKVPNFAAIHEKMNNKMINIVDYSQKKEERAKLLLSGQKPSTNSPVQYTKPVNNFSNCDSRLLTNSTGTPEKYKKANIVANGLTRFGLSTRTVGNSSKQEQIVALANRRKPFKSMTENVRLQIKGVRSNRRVDLLMKMRKN